MSFSHNAPVAPRGQNVSALQPSEAGAGAVRWKSLGTRLAEERKCVSADRFVRGVGRVLMQVCSLIWRINIDSCWVHRENLEVNFNCSYCLQRWKHWQLCIAWRMNGEAHSDAELWWDELTKRLIWTAARFDQQKMGSWLSLEGGERTRYTCLGWFWWVWGSWKYEPWLSCCFCRWLRP